MIRLSSLLLVEERLLEADYFARRLARSRRDPATFAYELNAFLSAARSVSFLLQKEMARVRGFSEWWEGWQTRLRSDPAARFFLELRNFSQKEGRVSVVGTSSGRSGKLWSRRFAGNREPVPPQLLHREVSDCCREHVSKLANIVMDCARVFPYASDPHRALTPEGIKALDLSIGDIEEALGFPRGWTEAGAPTDNQRQLEALRACVDCPDISIIQRLASWRPRPKQASNGPSERLSQDLGRILVSRLEERQAVTMADIAASLLLRESGHTEGE
jgi:hypothetical protein